jgi:hypothetical protein
MGEEAGKSVEWGERKVGGRGRLEKQRIDYTANM